jgi:autotransporter-associated beta strand protein
MSNQAIIKKETEALKRGVFVAVMLSLLLSSAHGALWDQMAAGTYDWNCNTNWTGPAAFPNAVGAEALLTNAINGSMVILLNQTITLYRVYMGDSSSPYSGYTFNANGGKFVFNVASGDVCIDKLVSPSGVDDEINVPIEYASGNLTLRNANTAGVLRVNSTIMRTGGTGGLIPRHNGSVELNGAVNIGNGWVTKMDSGTWRLNSTSNSWAGMNHTRGKIVLGAENALPVAGYVFMGAGTSATTAILDLGGYNQRIGGLGNVSYYSNEVHSVSSATPATLTISNKYDFVYGAASLYGTIDGAISLVKYGTPTQTLAGTNSYTGLTTIHQGKLKLTGGPNRIKHGNDIVVNSTLELAGVAQVFDSLTGTGTVMIAGSTLTMGSDGSSFTFDGTISQTGTVVKAGNGTGFLTGVNNYSGPTVVSNGFLVVTGSSPNSDHTVASGAKFGGYGTVGNVTVSSGGMILPSSTSHTYPLHTKSLSLSSNATYLVEIAGDASDAGQVDVIGTVSLGGATLSFGNAPTGTSVNSLTLINNDGADTVSGTFAGLTEGSLVSLGSMMYVISYQGGSSNNDVVLKALVCTPEDTEPPYLSNCPGNIIVPNDPGDCGAIVAWLPPTAVDNCDAAPIVTCSPAMNYRFTVGVTTVQCAAADTHTNQSFCAPFTVTVFDAEPPVINGGDTLLGVTSTNGSATASGYPSIYAVDNCAVQSVTFDPPAPHTFTVGQHPVQVIAGDVAGNCTTGTFNVVVEHRQLPSEELIGWWGLDEGYGTMTYNWTTNAPAGFLAGNPLPTWTDGVIWWALQFDGSQNYVRVPDSPGLSPQEELTVSAWVNLEMAGDGFTVSKWGTNGMSGSYLLWATTTNAEFHVFINGVQATVSATNQISAGQWHLLTGTYNGTNLSLYVDGALQNSVGATGLVDSVEEPLQIGGFSGKVDDVLLYSVALGAADILALYEEDIDDDGLSNVEEVNLYGTDPFNPDTDEDGMGDGWEVLCLPTLDPLHNDANDDPDNDSLANIIEYRINTSPCNPDSDNDGIPDGDEDADGDGVFNKDDPDPLDPNIGPPTGAAVSLYNAFGIYTNGMTNIFLQGDARSSTGAVTVAAVEWFDTKAGSNGTGNAMSTLDGSFDSTNETATIIFTPSFPPGERRILWLHARGSDGVWGNYVKVLINPNVNDILDKVKVNYSKITDITYTTTLKRYFEGQVAETQTIQCRQKGPFKIRWDNLTTGASTIINQDGIGIIDENGELTPLILVVGEDGQSQAIKMNQFYWDIDSFKTDHTFEEASVVTNSALSYQFTATPITNSVHSYDSLVCTVDIQSGAVTSFDLIFAGRVALTVHQVSIQEIAPGIWFHSQENSILPMCDGWEMREEQQLNTGSIQLNTGGLPDSLFDF